VIICTGSGIVVPFALMGRLLGARVLYVESGARVDGPSLSCRMVSRVAHRTYVQWPELARRVGEFHGRLPWERAVDPPAAAGEGRATVFTVGTSRLFPFDRLVRSSEAAGPSGTVLVQRGASTIRPDGAEVVDWLSFDALREQIGTAGAVVTHGGLGSVLLAVMLGHRPVVMPRRPELGESVDDHQVEFVRRLEREGLVTVAEGPADVARALGERRRRTVPPAARPNRLLRRLQQDVAEALA
jgi:UDP-N-acetylglucosamine transferase subunit ALG13